MLSRILFYALSILLLGLKVQGQEISSLAFHSQTELPFGFKVDGSIVGGLSGITFNNNDSSFYIVADKPPSRIFKVNISSADSLEIKFIKVLILSPPLLKNSELEGIAYNSETKSFYVSDEQSIGTRLLEMNNKAEFIRIIEPINQPFVELSSFNSGYEGLALDNNSQHLLYTFERPKDECHKRGLVKFSILELPSIKHYATFYYKLHPVANDVTRNNGVSEVLFINDSTLLVMERAYIPNQGNVVKLYKAYLNVQSVVKEDLRCDNDSILPIKTELLFDFVNVEGFNIDNAEGMTFNADKSLLIIVTDNNFSKKQETQIIALRVKWN